jgi:hypothetical protein
MDSIKSGVTIRLPSTANLYIDSEDAKDASGNFKFGQDAAHFTISKNQNIMAGFFTRLAVVEMVLDWCYDNISAALNNNTFSVDISGTTYTATLEDGNYTVEEVLDDIIRILNDLISALPNTPEFSIVSFPSGGGISGGGGKWIECFDTVGPVNFDVNVSRLQAQLDVSIIAGIGFAYPIKCPNLLPFKYIDFTCSNITYQQELKDATTSLTDRDVLYRWNFAWDESPPVDGYGYPIFQGYQRFIARRYLSFPKQVKWNAQQPIGQLQFEVFDDYAKQLILVGQELQWQMTLLVSEQ